MMAIQAKSITGKKSRLKIQIEPRLKSPRWLPVTVSVSAVILALLLSAVALRLSGVARPFQAYASIARELFGNWGGISDVLVQATPLILVGLACSVAFSMKLWNIGAEGQFFIGAFAASAIVLTPVLPAETPGWVFIPVMALAGLIGGALWGFVPGFLKAKFNVNEVITTLMMNYIAVEWNNFFIFGVWSEGGFQMSPRFPQHRLVAATGRLRPRNPRVWRPDPPPGPPVRPAGGPRRLVDSLPQQVGL